MRIVPSCSARHDAGCGQLRRVFPVGMELGTGTLYRSWLLRLGEFEEAFAGLPTPTPGFPSRRLSVLLSSDPIADVARIREFHQRVTNSVSGRKVIVESVEVKAESPSDVTRMARIIPRELTAYFEIPLAGHEGECITAIAGVRRRAKIRTGGESADKFPDSAGDRIRPAVRAYRCAVQGDGGTSPSDSLGASVHVSTGQSVGNDARLSEFVFGGRVCEGGNGNSASRWSCWRSSRRLR